MKNEEIEAAAASDTEQLIEHLFRSTYNRLMLFALASVQNQEHAEDLVQDTFHEAVRAGGLLLTHPNPTGWLVQTLKYKIRGDIRARNRYLLRFVSLDTDLYTDGVPSAQSVEDRAMPDAEEVLQTARKELMPEEYRLLKRIVLDGASHRETAAEFRITVWASKKRLERVRRKLERILEEKKKI